MWKINIFLVSIICCFFYLAAVSKAIAGMQEIVWKNVSYGITDLDLRFVVVSPGDEETVYVSSSHSVYKTINGGKEWDEVLSFRGTGNTVHAIALTSMDTKLVYAGTDDGLYRSIDGGMNWKKFFSGIGKTERAVLSLAISPETTDIIYIGTRSGLFLTKNTGKTLEKGRNIPSATGVYFIAIDHSNHHIIYAATDKGLYKSLNSGIVWNRIYETYLSGEGNYISNEAEATDIDAGEVKTEIRSIAIDPSNSKTVYVGTSEGLLITRDGGLTWEMASNLGLTSRDIRHIVVDSKDNDNVYAATRRGVFQHSMSTASWEEIYKGLFSRDIRYLAHIPAIQDSSFTLWAATKKGVFKTVFPTEHINAQMREMEAADLLSMFAHEPSIEEIREAAINYAEVHPEKIRAWRKAAAYRALLPDLRFEYAKNNEWQSSYYFYKDPTLNKYVKDDDITKDRDRDWSISLTWELGDLIWNDDQTSIDTRSRLMVQLRDDVLNEVTRLYFERRRLQVEIIISPSMEIKERLEKELRIHELTANIDSLTGSYLSKRLNLLR